jgi:hypothetical protein
MRAAITKWIDSAGRPHQSLGYRQADLFSNNSSGNLAYDRA